MIDQRVNMHSSLKLLRIWVRLTSLFHLSSLPYTEISSLLTEFIVIMHSILVFRPGCLSEKLCANIILELRRVYLQTVGQKGKLKVKQGFSVLLQ